MGVATAKPGTGRGTQRSEEELRLIAHAKSLLMQRCGLSEQQAHRNLQRLSMETSHPLVEVAQRVIDLLEAGSR